MREGRRLPAMVVMIGLLAGCSDPAGAVRRERAAARKSSPSATPDRTKRHTPAWWQAQGQIKVSNGLRIHTGALRAGRMRVAITDVKAGASRTVVATAQPHRAVVGHFTLTGIKVAKNAVTGVYGVTFHYRHR